MRALAASSRRALAPTALQRLQPRRQASRAMPPPATATAGGAPQQPATPAARPSERQQHAAYQAAFFNEQHVKELRDSITPDVEARLARVAASIPGLSAETRVLDAGAGEGALIPHLQASRGRRRGWAACGLLARWCRPAGRAGHAGAAVSRGRRMPCPRHLPALRHPVHSSLQQRLLHLF